MCIRVTWYGISAADEDTFMTTKDLTIGVLSITAVILLAALIIIQNVGVTPAMAYGQNERAGDFLVSTAQLDGTAELIMVVEAAQQKMNVYGFNVQAGQIELVQQMDLGPLQRVSQPTRAPAGRRER
jgi:hypothetical protein